VTFFKQQKQQAICTKQNSTALTKQQAHVTFLKQQKQQRILFPKASCDGFVPSYFRFC